MALKSTIFKTQITVSDLNRHHYESYSITVARHPSETDLRMMMRIAAFALNASERLQFTRGLCEDSEPDLWEFDYTDRIQQWIELGQPDEKRLRKACAQAKKVSIYTYQESASVAWWNSMQHKAQRFNNLKISHLQLDTKANIEDFVERSMKINCMIQDEHILLTKDWQNLNIEIKSIK